MKKGQEIYLISLALVLLATILIYEVVNTPELSPVVTNTSVNNYSNTVSNSYIDSTDSTETSKDKYDNGSPTTSNNINYEKKSSGSKLININTASFNELLTLNGIGEVKANAIIDYRNQNGYFISIEELTNVSGIGEKTFEKIKDYITV